MFPRKKKEKKKNEELVCDQKERCRRRAAKAGTSSLYAPNREFAKPRWILRACRQQVLLRYAAATLLSLVLFSLSFGVQIVHVSVWDLIHHTASATLK